MKQDFVHQSNNLFSKARGIITLAIFENDITLDLWILTGPDGNN